MKTLIKNTSLDSFTVSLLFSLGFQHFLWCTYIPLIMTIKIWRKTNMDFYCQRDSIPRAAFLLRTWVTLGKLKEPRFPYTEKGGSSSIKELKGSTDSYIRQKEPMCSLPKVRSSLCKDLGPFRRLWACLVDHWKFWDGSPRPRTRKPQRSAFESGSAEHAWHGALKDLGRWLPGSCHLRLS